MGEVMSMLEYRVITPFLEVAKNQDKIRSFRRQLIWEL